MRRRCSVRHIRVCDGTVTQCEEILCGRTWWGVRGNMLGETVVFQTDILWYVIKKVLNTNMKNILIHEIVHMQTKFLRNPYPMIHLLFPLVGTNVFFLTFHSFFHDNNVYDFNKRGQIILSLFLLYLDSQDVGNWATECTPLYGLSFLAPCLCLKRMHTVSHQNTHKWWEKGKGNLKRQPDNLHFRVNVYFTNFWETVPAHKHSRSKLDAYSWLTLSEANPLSEGAPSVSQRWEICSLQPPVTSDAHIMPSLPWRNMTGPLTVRHTEVFGIRGLAIFSFSPLLITHPLE